MVYDCFSFFNELDLLEIRLNVLKDVVDRFVLVEAGETHTGKPKPFYFEENRGRFAAFADRITYLKIEKFPPGHGAWWNENYQRNELMKGLVGAKDDDDVLISDLDEIPNPDEVRRWKGTPGVKVFRQKCFAFYLNYWNARDWWLCTTKMLPYRDVKNVYDGLSVVVNEFLPADLNVGTTLTKIRRCRLPRSRGGERVIRAGGWHFSCLGGAEAMARKMRAVAPHHDFNPDDPTLTPERMAALIERGLGPALSMHCFAEPIDETYPRYVRENQELLSRFVFRVTPGYLREVRLARLFRGLQGRLIKIGERLCPPALHNWLHRVKMCIFLSRRGRACSGRGQSSPSERD